MSASLDSSDAGHLTIQVHLERAPDLDLSALRLACERSAAASGSTLLSFSDGPSASEVVEASFESPQVDWLWRHLSASIFQGPAHGAGMSAASIVVRTGASGWDDYRLLQSYAEPADALPPARRSKRAP